MRSQVPFKVRNIAVYQKHNHFWASSAACVLTNDGISGEHSKLGRKKRPFPQLAGIKLVMRLIGSSCGFGPPLEWAQREQPINSLVLLKSGLWSYVRAEGTCYRVGFLEQRDTLFVKIPCIAFTVSFLVSAWFGLEHLCCKDL